MTLSFNHYSEQHSSKTGDTYVNTSVKFWNHSEQHSSKTKDHHEKLRKEVLEPFRTTQL